MYIDRNLGTRKQILLNILISTARNLSDLLVTSSRHDILFCPETLVSDMRHMSELLVSGFGRWVLLFRGKIPLALGMEAYVAAYVRDGYGAFRQIKFECGCCKMTVLVVCGVRQNFYVFSLHLNPDLDDPIFDCLLTLMAAVQAENVDAAFLFVGDLNGHHQEWLGWFYNHESSWCFSLWLLNWVWLLSIGRRPVPCTL